MKLTPRGGTDRIDGPMQAADGRDFLTVRVRAVPEKGAANAALEVLPARSPGMPKGAVSVTASHTARVKTVRLAGNRAQLAAAVGALVQEQMEEGAKRR